MYNLSEADTQYADTLRFETQFDTQIRYATRIYRKMVRYAVDTQISLRNADLCSSWFRYATSFSKKWQSTWASS